MFQTQRQLLLHDLLMKASRELKHRILLYFSTLFMFQASSGRELLTFLFNDFL